MKKFLLFIAGLLVAGGSAAGVIFFFYQDGMPFQQEGTPPLVEADENPFKVRPENPEGMEFAHRDNTAYDAIENPEGAVDDGVVSLQDPPDLPTSPAFDDDTESDNPYQEDGALSSEALALLEGDEEPVNTSAAPEADGQGGTESAAVPPQASPDDNKGESSDPVTSETEEADADTRGEVAETADQPVAAQATAADVKPVAVPSTSLAKSVRIQLGSLRSKALAEREWKRLAGRHNVLLGALTLHVQQADLGARGVFYRVQAGPLVTVQAAREVCRQLESKKVGCIVVRP